MKKMLLLAFLSVMMMCSCDKNTNRYDDIPGLAPDEEGYVEVVNVEVSSKIVVIPVGEQSMLQYTVAPKNATVTDVEFLSENSSIAKINEDGVITALCKGHVIITITSKDNADKKTLCLVQVIDKEKE